MTVNAPFQLTSQAVRRPWLKVSFDTGSLRIYAVITTVSARAGLLQEGLHTVHVEPISIHPGSPWENDYNERFNGTLRHEVLDTEVFYSLAEAQSVIAQWIHQYNHIRPHQSLDHRPPVPETIAPPLSQHLVHTQGA